MADSQESDDPGQDDRFPRLPRSWWNAIAVAIVVLPLSAIGFLNFTAFCKDEKRYLTNTELIRRAIANQANKIAGMEEGSGAEIGDFLKQNPDCCRIEGHDFFLASSALAKVMGLGVTWVRVVYRMKDEVIAWSPADGAYYEAFVGTNGCGRAIETTGMRMMSPD